MTAPAHTIVNALPPAPVASRHIIGQMLPDVVFGGLRHAIPDDRGPSHLAVVGFKMRPNLRQIDEAVDLAQEVIAWDMTLKAEA